MTPQVLVRCSRCGCSLPQCRCVLEASAAATTRESTRSAAALGCLDCEGACECVLSDKAGLPLFYGSPEAPSQS